MQWYIDCYKGKKIVNRIDLIMNEKDFVKMLANQVIFYQTHDLNHTEIHNLRQYDRIAINGNVYYDLLEFVDNRDKVDIDKKQMKVMISQPMNGKTEEQIRNERKYLVRELEEEGYEVLDNVFEDFDDDVSPIYYLAKSIEILDQADIVVFMEGWENARGCVIEHEIALFYHKYIKEL